MTPTTILTLFASLWAVSAAIFASVVARRGSVGHLSKRFDTLQARLSQLEDATDAQTTALMNLRARLTMQATREKRRQPELTASSPPSGDASSDDDKARVRRELAAKLANGSIKPPGR